jgi:DNA-binding response OmpR family regulator
MDKLKALIVEDERLIAFALKQTLEYNDYDVTVVYTKGDAIKQTEEFLPDIVLLDVTLENRFDGIEIAQHIRSSTNVPVIFITGLTTEIILEQDERINSDAIFEKPVDTMTILKAIKQITP